MILISVLSACPVFLLLDHKSLNTFLFLIYISRGFYWTSFPKRKHRSNVKFLCSSWNFKPPPPLVLFCFSSLIFVFNTLLIIVQYSFYYEEIIILLQKLALLQNDMIRNFQLISKWSVVWFPFISDGKGERSRNRSSALSSILLWSEHWNWLTIEKRIKNSLLSAILERRNRLYLIAIMWNILGNEAT